MSSQAELAKRKGPIQVGEVLRLAGLPGWYIVTAVHPDGSVTVYRWKDDEDDQRRG